MNDFTTGLIRTYVPILVGAAVAWLITRGVAIDAQTQTAAIVALTGISQAVYYTAVRYLAKRWPAVEILLGVKSAPNYGQQGKVAS